MSQYDREEEQIIQAWRAGNITKKCDCCGKETPDVAKCLDPYSAEINDEEVELYLCLECYQDKQDDI